MLHQILKSVLQTSNKRCVATSSALLHRVTVIGSAGGVGKSLCMFLKANTRVTDLVLMDIEDTAGIAADLSHIDTFSEVSSFQGIEKMTPALKCSELVIVAAAVDRADKGSTEAILDANKQLIYNVASLKGSVCAEAFLVIITNPIDALVPLAAETLKLANVYDSKKLFGITNIDTIRARAFIGDHLVIDPKKVSVNVVGGHSNTTIVPLLSSASPTLPQDTEEWEHIYDRVRKAGSGVLETSSGKQPAQLAISYAAAMFCDSLLKAMDGVSGVTDVAFVESKIYPEVKYFSTKFDLNKGGIKKFHALPAMSSYERNLLKKATLDLQKSMEEGVKYAKHKKEKKVIDRDVQKT